MVSNKLYDILNKIQRWLPSVGIFYLALCQIWGLPFGEGVNATIIAIAAFMAATLEVLDSRYNKSLLDNIQE